MVYSWPALITLAEATAPLQSIVDPDAPEFLNPDDLTTAIKNYCRATGQPEPQTVGAVVRCCLESLALRYRWVLAALEDVVGHPLDTIRIVGGSQNHLLCQLTADACGRRVVAGPVEATALGNIMVQKVATGYLQDISAGRQAIEASVHLARSEPQLSVDWDSAFLRFQSLLPTVGG